MKSKLLFVGLILCVIMLINIGSAESQYGKINVYYNDMHLTGTEVAKPTLKIGEPFSVAIEMTLYQDCMLDYKILELGTNDYIVIDGPSELNQYENKVFTSNETHTFKWTLKPTDEWTAGTMPLNFHYTIYVLDEYDPVVNSEFTIAVPYITTEYYEGDTTPATTTDPESPSSTDDPTTPSTPAFTLFASALAIALVAARRS